MDIFKSFLMIKYLIDATFLVFKKMSVLVKIDFFKLMNNSSVYDKTVGDLS